MCVCVPSYPRLQRCDGWSEASLQLVFIMKIYPVCVHVHEERADRTSLSFTKLSSSMKGCTHTFFDHRLGNDECGTRRSFQLQGSNLETPRPSFPPFLTAKRCRMEHYVETEVGDVHRWWPDPRDQAGWCRWPFLWVDWMSRDLPLWTMWTVATPNDRCFIILMINLEKSLLWKLPLVWRFTH